MKENSYGIIYQVINNKNGKIYIGSTTQNIESRKKDHINKANKNIGHKFQKAIGTYGADAFEWKVIDTAKDSNELAIKERNYIIEYNSKEIGYNSDSGGGIKKTIYQYNIEDGSLVDSFDSLESASSAISASIKALSKTCLSVNQQLGGYYWSYKYKIPFEPHRDKRKKIVYQYDIDGYLLAKYTSVKEASEETGVNRGSISKVCRLERNQAGGFLWVYDVEEYKMMLDDEVRRSARDSK